MALVRESDTITWNNRDSFDQGLIGMGQGTTSDLFSLIVIVIYVDYGYSVNFKKGIKMMIV